MKTTACVVLFALAALCMHAVEGARYECHKINNYCSKSAWMVFGYYDTRSRKWVTHGWWNIPANKAKTYCFYRGQDLWMYWDWDGNYGGTSDVTFPLPGDWTACTCTVKQKIYYNYNGHPFYESYSKNIGTTCSGLGLRNCRYRKLEKIDNILYGSSNIKNSCPRRRLGDGGDGSESGLVIGGTVEYTDIPEAEQGDVVFVEEDKEIADAAVN